MIKCNSCGSSILILRFQKRSECVSRWNGLSLSSVISDEDTEELWLRKVQCTRCGKILFDGDVLIDNPDAEAIVMKVADLLKENSKVGEMVMKVGLRASDGRKRIYVRKHKRRKKGGKRKTVSVRPHYRTPSRRRK